MEKLGFQKIKDNIKEQSGDQDRNLIKKKKKVKAGNARVEGRREFIHKGAEILSSSSMDRGRVNVHGSMDPDMQWRKSVLLQDI